MSLTRPVLTVALTSPENSEPVEHRLEVTPGDQFRAEFECARHSIQPKHQPVQVTAVWAWCALTRLGTYTGDYQTFAHRDLYAFDIKSGEEVPVDPTTEPSGSASSAPITSPDSSTGSTPTSTSGS